MMIDENHYVTREEYQQLLALAQPKKRGGVIQFLCSMLLVALAVVGGYFLLVMYVGEAPAPAGAATTAPAATPPRTNPTPGSFGSAPPPPTLPDCATVTDSRTACSGAVGEMPQGQAEEEPRYVTETCLTPPGARPCWLPADAAWGPPATVPETPIVLLPEPTTPPLVFADSACAAWHAPLPWPEGCPIGGDE